MPDKLLCGVLLCLMHMSAWSQTTDYGSSFTSTSSKYIRFHYDNDYFTKSDEYYSQGVILEVVLPALKFSPAHKLLPGLKNSATKYGISMVHLAYTPTTIRSDEILYGDRPFSANLTLNHFKISVDTINHRLLTATVVVGIMGQAAGGKEVQQTLHRWLNNMQPHGWQYQIQNDIILTYQINYEKKLVNWKDRFILNTAAEIKAGTYMDKLKLGFNFLAGNLNDPYRSFASDIKNKKKFRYYFYGQVQPGITAYDASLQGGLFNLSSAYTIPASAIKRFTVQADYGIVVSIGKIYLEYRQSVLSKEFNTGHYHRWGGVTMGVDL
jgi:hypothetical protein